MKKRIIFSLIIISILSSLWAAPKGIRVPDTIDNNISDEQLVTVIVNKFVALKKIDDCVNPVNTTKFSKEPVFDKSLNDFLKVRTVLLEPGEHVISFGFRTNARHSAGYDYTVTLEAGKTYELIADSEEDYNAVFFDIQECETHTSLLPGVKLTYKQQLAIQYAGILEYIENNNPFILRGNDYSIEYGPDMSVKYTEKGKVYEGFIGFEATNAVIYIQFNKDGKLTKESFLELNPENCDRVYRIKAITDFDNILRLTIEVKKGKEVILNGIK